MNEKDPRHMVNKNKVVNRFFNFIFILIDFKFQLLIEKIKKGNQAAKKYQNFLKNLELF